MGPVQITYQITHTYSKIPFYVSKDHPTRGSSDHHEFVHPALRVGGAPSKGRPGPGSLMGGEGAKALFHGEEGKQMRKPMEFRVNIIFKVIFHLT